MERELPAGRYVIPSTRGIIVIEGGKVTYGMETLLQFAVKPPDEIISPALDVLRGKDLTVTNPSVTDSAQRDRVLADIQNRERYPILSTVPPDILTAGIIESTVKLLRRQGIISIKDLAAADPAKILDNRNVRRGYVRAEIAIALKNLAVHEMARQSSTLEEIPQQP